MKSNIRLSQSLPAIVLSALLIYQSAAAQSASSPKAGQDQALKQGDLFLSGLIRLLFSAAVRESLKKSQDAPNLSRAAALVEQANTEPDAEKRKALLVEASSLITNLSAKETTVLRKEVAVAAQYARLLKDKRELQLVTETLQADKLQLQQQAKSLQQEKSVLQATATRLESEKATLTKEKEALEFRERLLATGLIASLSTLLVAVMGGLLKWPLLRMDRAIKHLDLEERTLRVELLRSQQNQSVPLRRLVVAKNARRRQHEA
jgi:hypothetical protein